MNILFLDFDGVLTTRDSISLAKEMSTPNRIEHHALSIDRECMKNLNRVVTTSGCAVVVTGAIAKLYNKQELQYMFNRAGFKHMILDVAPGMPREEAISEWIGGWPYPIAKFACVDDSKPMYNKYSEWLVHTNFDTGLTAEAADQLVSLFR